MSVLSDFNWSWRGVHIKETGADIAFSRDLFWDVTRGLHYIIREALRRPAPPLALKVTYAPRAPRPWYLLWGALRQAGIQSGTPADLTIHFSDQTYVKLPFTEQPNINGRCQDISKTHVAETFETIFGYSLTIDPTEATEPFLEKGELNGTHDGRIVEHPMTPQANHVYQKLIDNRTQDGTVLDYRCPTVFGEIPLVFLKERPINQRFANMNSRVRLAEPSACFSPEEIRKISAFCAAMNLDWGGLDVLRDAKDGRIYIVDVNKTDMGPPLSLSIKDKLHAVKTLGLALREALLERS